MSTEPKIPGSANSGPVSDRFLREPEVLKLVGVSKMTLRRWEEADLFPKRYKIGPNIVAWRESEIHAWIANRAISTSGKGTA